MPYDDAYPQSGSASTANVRANFTALQNAGLFVNLLQDKNPAFDSWSAGAASAPDSWTLSGAGAAVARDADEEYGDYAAKITYGAADAYLYVDLDEFAYYQDKYVSLSAQIKTSTASIARLTISDGVGSTNSAYHTGGGTYENIPMSHQVDSAATRVRVELHVTGAGNAIFDCIVLTVGEVQPLVFPPPIFGSLSSAAYAYLSADQNNIADATETKVTLDTEAYDIGSDFDTTNNKFVAPQAGYYMIIGSIEYKALGANNARTWALIKKNNTTNISSCCSCAGTQVQHVTAQTSTLVYLAAADYIELFAYHEAGVANPDIESADESTYLIVYLVAAA